MPFNPNPNINFDQTFGGDVTIFGCLNISDACGIKFKSGGLIKENSSGGIDITATTVNIPSLVTTTTVNGGGGNSQGGGSGGSVVTEETTGIVGITSTGSITNISISSFILVGMIVAFPNATIPEGWLECNGATIPAEYTELIALIGNNVPDLRGEFIRGFDNGKGVDSGRTLGSTQAAEFESHNHSASTSTNNLNHRHTNNGRKLSLNTVQSSNKMLMDNNWANVQVNLNSNYTNPGHTVTVTVGNQGGTETRPRNVPLIYIIRAAAL